MGLEAELAGLRSAWPSLVERMSEAHPVLRTDLLDSWPERLTESTCAIGFDPEFPGEIGEMQKNGLETVHRVVVHHLTRSVKVEFCVASAPVRWSHHLKKPVTPTGVPSGNLRSWEQNPAIRQVLEVFHGDVRDVQT